MDHFLPGFKLNSIWSKHTLDPERFSYQSRGVEPRWSWECSWW